MAIFVTGVFANELLLLLQGLSSINDVNWSFVPLLLFAAAIVMFAGLGLLLISHIVPVTRTSKV